jgi:hypothetical protein
LEIRIDDWFLPDPKAFEKRLDQLIETTRFAGPSHILLDVFAHDARTGAITGAYFPGSSYPLRADAANRLVQLLQGKVPAAVVVRLPEKESGLVSLSALLCQFLPVQGLAIPGTVPRDTATALMEAARGWRPEAKRFDWSAPGGSAASGPHFHLVMMEEANLANFPREIPFVDLANGVETASEQLREWLRAGGRHAAAGPLSPWTDLQNLKSFRKVVSANSNPYRESLIRQLQRAGRP